VIRDTPFRITVSSTDYKHTFTPDFSQSPELVTDGDGTIYFAKASFCKELIIKEIGWFWQVYQISFTLARIESMIQAYGTRPKPSVPTASRKAAVAVAI
jgi:hypothetical protein